MKNYDAIIIGTGSGVSIANRLLRDRPDARVAVIDKDKPGGICLTRGCIPSKLVISPVEILHDAERLSGLIEVRDIRVNFRKIMERMREKVGRESSMIERSLEEMENIDYFKKEASFTAPYTLKVSGEEITSKKIFIGSGSRPMVPEIKGLRDAGFLTSDTLLELEDMPESMIIVGGGYVAVEYGNFFARAGCDVKIVEMMPRILSNEEPEISRIVQEELSNHAELFTSHRVTGVEGNGKVKRIVAEGPGGKIKIEGEEILVAVGRESNSDILKPQLSGIETDERGWIKVNEFLETSVPGIYAIGDANGRYMFRHVANREAATAYANAFHDAGVKMDYSAVPHAVFTQPEVGSVGMAEKEAVERFGRENILIGFEELKTTGKGLAMNSKGFAKVIVHGETGKILGGHIAGKSASVLVQEIATLMALDATYHAALHALHIHPSLSEVVSWAFGNLMSVDEYHRMMEKLGY
ncbi:dihydrolipoyl dehydrogenase [Geoglobus acetivorans]|uniref:Dihydrolipoamide dehydrogenase n=1 Tax=Geoglobus acetivorans TaxID=565033 RepID=A0A0A7GC82_GEOAI|nr:Dihydrolipoamide dehydrogenase [Geoglobus acetivorans]